MPLAGSQEDCCNGEVGQQDSFDFEQDGGCSETESDDLDGWGSEFDGDDDVDEYEVEADASGKMGSVDMMHRTYWEGLKAIDDELADSDPTGRYKYVRACQRRKIRPSVSTLLALSEEKMLLQHHGVRSCDAVALAAGLEQNSCLSVVNLSGNTLGDAGEALGKAFAENSTIQHLIMRQAKLNASLGRHLAISLQNNDALTHIELGSNRIGDEGVACLLRAIGPSVEYLGVADNQAGPRACEAITSTIPSNTSLRTLDVSWNHFRKTEMNAVADAVAKNNGLTTVWLAWNGIGDLDPRHEDDEMEDKKLATTSRASDNGGKFAHGIVRMVNECKSLTDLDLSNCRIGPALGKGLADAIAKNWSIVAIKLDSNPFGTAGEDIMSALRSRQEGGSSFMYTCDNCSMDPSRSSSKIYDAGNPSGRYCLDLADPADQALAKMLLKNAKSSCGDMWRGEKLNGVRFNYPAQKGAKWLLPTEGTMELDLSYMDGEGSQSDCVHAEDFAKFCKVMQNQSTDAAKLTMLKRACQAYYFDIAHVLEILLMFHLDSTREAALVMLFNKITQPDKLFSVLTVFSERARLSLHRRLGPIWFWNNAYPAARYWLDLGKNNDRTTLQRLIDFHSENPGTTCFKEVRFARDPSHTLVHAKSLDDLLEPDMMNKATLPTAGIVELEFIMDSQAGVPTNDVVEGVKRHQYNKLFAETENDGLAVAVAASASRQASGGQSRSSRRRREGEGLETFTRPSSQNHSRPVTQTSTRPGSKSGLSRPTTRELSSCLGSASREIRSGAASRGVDSYAQEAADRSTELTASRTDEKGFEYLQVGESRQEDVAEK